MGVEESQRMGELEEKIELILANQELVLGAIRGNPILNDGGMIKDISNLSDKVDRSHNVLSKRIELLENRVKPIEFFMQRVNWTLVIIGFISSLIGAVVGILISIFKK